MAKKKKTKEKTGERKIIREFVETRFKEVEETSEETESEGNQQESELEQDINMKRSGEFSDFSEFEDSGRRTAPTITANEQVQETNLESTAETAPAVRETEGTGNLYEARTAAERGYGQEDYTTRDRQISVEDFKPSELLDRPFRNLTLFAPRTMPIQQQESEWQSQNQARQITPERKDYEIIDESLKKKLPFERKKRIT